MTRFIAQTSRLFCGLVCFHLIFILIEFAFAFASYLILASVLRENPMGSTDFRMIAKIRFGAMFEVTQIYIRFIIGNYLLYFLLWQIPMRRFVRYLVSIAIPFVLWSISIKLEGELSQLAHIMFNLNAVSLSIIFGILFANFAMLKYPKHWLRLTNVKTGS